MKICETGGSDGFVRRTTDTKLKSDYRQDVVSWIFWYTISGFSVNEVLLFAVAAPPLCFIFASP